MSKLETSELANASGNEILCLAASWLLAVIVCVIAVVAWGGSYGWHVTPLSAYLLFPLLGLLAFSLMWTHYMSVAIRGLLHVDRKVQANYFRYTGYIVLALICLHPGILIYQRFRDGYGLPPHSYETYVAPGLGWITVLGSASLLVFLAFEFHRVYSDRKWWHYVSDASDIAMLAIIYHGLKLGSQLQQGWFHSVWIFYSVSLVAVLIHKYYKRFTKDKAR